VIICFVAENIFCHYSFKDCTFCAETYAQKRKDLYKCVFDYGPNYSVFTPAIASGAGEADLQLAHQEAAGASSLLLKCVLLHVVEKDSQDLGYFRLNITKVSILTPLPCGARRLGY
jgi:hypothetical protein